MSALPFEAERRMLLARTLSDSISNVALGVAVVGSVAHSPQNVKSSSDLDMIIIADDSIHLPPVLSIGFQQRPLMISRHLFDGYCMRSNFQEIPISMHVYYIHAFNSIINSFTSNLRLYRTDTKEEDHTLYSFQGDPLTYTIHNYPLAGITGVCNIIPVALQVEQTYYSGVPRNKLLSMPLILYEKDHIFTTGIEQLWNKTTEHLIQESLHKLGRVDLNHSNIHKSLAKKENMGLAAQQYIWENTRRHFPNLL